ncbi:FHA domain-containing protein DDL [Daucus carota subsp. sativus]|uniref:FHA domain-containing protein DDL n=1 Tax=Daucus carota subsp. sativus TaxID=79200 RepID=UPI0007EFB48B|nr:PREDICTED: FHA domain-containing protein DDL [Daucus carota subsp. sativus]
MGRHPSDDSESPVRTRESSRKRSPPRREKSPARNKSSYKARSPVREKPSSRTRSPRQAMSRSPEKSRLREKPSGRTRSPRRGKSRSPVSDSPVKDKPLSQGRSLRHTKSSYSPVRDKPSSRARSRSPVHHLPSRERTSNQTRSPKRPKSISPAARSPSPRTKRLRRAKDENESVIGSERAQKTNLRVSERSTRREKDSEDEEPNARRENKSGRDAIRNGSSRSRRGRSGSPSGHNHTRSRSPPNASERRDRDEVTISRKGEYNSRGGEQGNPSDDSVAKMAAAAEALEKKEKQKPSFELSGKLAEETNRFRGITLLFNEAPDARKPETRWRLYVFKGGDVLNEPLYVHRQTSYLFGRERRVADIPTDHPSCSKQHAVLQYRQVETEQPDGTLSKQVRPYIMDLGSTNGTFINEERIDPQRYYELREKDTIKFGNSSREYVLLHENSAG